MQGIDAKVSQLAHWRSGVPQQVAAYGLLARLRDAEGLLSESWARLMTKYLLVIVLPTEMLRLGRDVPLPNPTEPMFPFPLMDLSLPSMDDYNTRRAEERCGRQIGGAFSSSSVRSTARRQELAPRRTIGAVSTTA